MTQRQRKYFFFLKLKCREKNSLVKKTTKVTKCLNCLNQMLNSKQQRKKCHLFLVNMRTSSV